MPDYTITAFKHPAKPIASRLAVGDNQEYSLDFSPWAEEYNGITSATWTVESGDASITNTVLAGNITTANITQSDEGKSLIKVSATDGTLVKNIYLDLYFYDPEEFFEDYV